MASSFTQRSTKARGYGSAGGHPRRVVLALLRPGRPAEAPPRDRTGESGPRGFIFEDLFDETWDVGLIDQRPSRWPAWLRLAIEVHRRRDDYDVIVTWGERLTLALMALQRLRGGKPHIAFVSQFSKPNIRTPFRWLGRTLRAAITSTSVQRDYAVAHRLVPADRLFLVRFFVDHRFFHPIDMDDDGICAVGAEMRDFPTLFAALEGTPLRCHVAADVVRVPGRWRLLKDRRVRIETLQTTPNPRVTVGRKDLAGLRELYARSRFVVVPLLPSRSDNGVTVVLEAMAMGKAVICTRTEGQVDVIEDGVTGLLVPPGDPAALRDAMLALWNDPERARAMGARGRALVEARHTLEQFCDNVGLILDAAMSDHPPPHRGWWDAAAMHASAVPER
ncbi:MAG: glycosyltransferase family 4 protein [Acidobacteria bacterium]|nr:glycosyltransferase family 4 protein [Acidobacteriota bacterium]